MGQGPKLFSCPKCRHRYLGQCRNNWFGCIFLCSILCCYYTMNKFNKFLNPTPESIVALRGRSRGGAG